MPNKFTQKSNVETKSPTPANESTNNEDKFAKPLAIDEVRWFYTEHEQMIPFNGYDSIKLEIKYRKLFDEFGNMKIKPVPTDVVVVRGDMYEVHLDERKGYPLFWIAKQSDPTVLKVKRGTWFYQRSKMPLECDSLAFLIEDTHMKIYQQSKTGNSHRKTMTQKMAMKLTEQLGIKQHVLEYEQYKVEWITMNKVFMSSSSVSQYVKNKLGVGHYGNRILRGYPEKAVKTDKFPDITHICFVIHGIGQKRNNNISSKSDELRFICEKLKGQHFPRLDKLNQRVEFLPVNWRKSLKLDGKTVEYITLMRNRQLRKLVNASVLDILYYTSPRYRHEIIDSLVSELNRIYTLFCERVPYFIKNNGKISVVAHSLGTVLIYDVLTGWSPAEIYADLSSKKPNNARTSVGYEKLAEAKEKARNMEFEFLKHEEECLNKNDKRLVPFHVENLFLIGSPLAVFLALRGVDPQHTGLQEDLFPPEICNRVFNVFHSADPVVYRIEPLINPFYHDIDPVKIHRVNNISKPEYSTILTKKVKNLKESLGRENLQKLEATGSIPQNDSDECIYQTVLSLDHCNSNLFDTHRAKSIWNRNSINKFEMLRFSGMSVSPPQGMLKMMTTNMDSDEIDSMYLKEEDRNRETLRFRIDYRLPEARNENAFLSVLTSHICYWTNGEFCMFLLTQLFGHLGVDGNPS